MSFPFPEYVQLYPTIRCNQQCSFCFNSPCGEGLDMTHGESLELLKILSAHGIASLDVMGGEPFLLDWMPDFMATAARRGMQVNISTNGSRPEVMRRLKGMNPASVNIGVSLEGSTAQAHNALTRSPHFDLALRSIRCLVSLGLDPIVKTVLNRTTLEDIENIIALIGGLGVRRYYLIHMDVMSKDPSLLYDSLPYTDFIECWQKIRKGSSHVGIFRVNASCFTGKKLPPGARCAGGVVKLSITPDGSVYPCTLFHRCEEFRLGNIFEEDLSVLWARPNLSFFRTFRENRCNVEDCKNRAACTGGCPAHGYLHLGDPDAPDVRCSASFGAAHRH
jgi:radical SAM protein with 4Fe4S-binding SPASM domain